MIHPETHSRQRNSGLQTITNRYAAKLVSRMQRYSQGTAVAVLILAGLHFGADTAAGQSVGLNNATPDASSILDLTATNRGLLIPRMEKADKNAIGTPATGLLVYQINDTAGFYFYDGGDWVALSTAATGWGVTGNAGTTSGTNFIGTTDAQSMDFRTNNVIRTRITQKGQIEILNTGESVFIGEGAGASDDLSTNQNVFVGYQAGNANTTGNSNTALGATAGSTNTTGSSNTFVGYNADAASNALTNATAIGANASVSASNTIQLGDASVTSVATNGALTTGEVTYPNTDGSRDQVLATNGSGTLYWQSASPIVHDWMSSHAASRHIQFNLTTGELYIVGEIAHGLDFYAGGGFWRCSFGDYGSSPILTALLREYINEGGGIPGGLGTPYTDPDQYSVLPLTPLTNQNTYQNTSAGNTDFPADYVPVATGSLEFFIYQLIDGEFAIAVMDDAGIFDQAPGDGTIDEDNGVRIDIAFKADLSMLQGNKTRWLQEVDDSSPAYDTKHPAGF